MVGVLSGPTFEEDALEQERKACLLKGGKWNPLTQTCDEPEPEPKPVSNPAGGTGTSAQKEKELFGTPKEQQARAEEEKQKAGFGVLRGEEGRLSGFTRGDRTLLGLSPSEVRGLAEKEAGLQELEIGGQAEQVISNREQQEAGLRAAAGVSRTPLDELGQVEQIQLNLGNAALSALPNLAENFIGSLVGVAAFREIAGGKGGAKAVGKLTAKTALKKIAAPFNIGVAVLATVGGFYKDVMQDLERQRGEAVEAPIRTLTETKPLLGKIVSAQHTNPNDRELHKKLFAFQQQQIQDDYDNLKALTDSELTALLGVNGIDQLKEFEVYYSGEAQQIEFEFQDALANPDPSKIRATSLDIEEMKRRLERDFAE